MIVSRIWNFVPSSQMYPYNRIYITGNETTYQEQKFWENNLCALRYPHMYSKVGKNNFKSTNLAMLKITISATSLVSNNPLSNWTGSFLFFSIVFSSWGGFYSSRFLQQFSEKKTLCKAEFHVKFNPKTTDKFIYLGQNNCIITKR
jgi:hypothetical protein